MNSNDPKSSLTTNGNTGSGTFEQSYLSVVIRSTSCLCIRNGYHKVHLTFHLAKWPVYVLTVQYITYIIGFKVVKNPAAAASAPVGVVAVGATPGCSDPTYHLSSHHTRPVVRQLTSPLL